MELDLAVLADAATMDASGKLNLLGVFDRIQSREFPVRHGRIALALRFSATPEEVGVHDVAIHLVGPSERELLRLDGRMELRTSPGGGSEGMRLPQILNLDGIVFPEPGDYTFRILVGGRQVSSLGLTVEKVRVAPPRPTPTPMGDPPPLVIFQPPGGGGVEA